MENEGYLPDLGLYFQENDMVMKDYSFIGLRLDKLVACDTNLFTTLTSQTWDNQMFAISLDIPLDVVQAFIDGDFKKTPSKLQQEEEGFYTIQEAVIVSVQCTLGELVESTNEKFIPFLVHAIELL